MYINRGIPNRLGKKFDKIFQQNLFHGASSKSGNGSSLDQTRNIALSLTGLIRELGIQSILDIPCGDLEWMANVNLGITEYIGGDVAPSLITFLQNHYIEKNFQVLDISRDILPKVDLIFCRDLFVHLSYKDIQSALRNIRKSGSTYLATTTFKNTEKNKDLALISRGVAWRPLNLEKSPFDFVSPQILIDEKCTENGGAYADKSIGVWKIKALP